MSTMSKGMTAHVAAPTVTAPASTSAPAVPLPASAASK
jgi:hypothetical protein